MERPRRNRVSSIHGQTRTLSAIAKQSASFIVSFELERPKVRLSNPASKIFLKRGSVRTAQRTPYQFRPCGRPEYLNKCFLKLMDGITQNEIECWISPLGKYREVA